MSQGSQKILYQFQTPLDSDYLNGAFQDIFSIGIYSGFTVNILGDTSVQINTGKYIISDGTYSAIIENQASATITIGSATPYIIIRWTYLKQANNFAVISAVAHASILSTDIIIGKGIYNGSTLDSISYIQQTKPIKILSENLFDNLKVLENSTPAMNVVVNAGVIVTNDGLRHIFSSTTTKTISAADATNPRIDLIAIDTSGVIQVVAGTPAASPSVPSYSNYFVLAEVYVDANVTTIYQDNITDVRNFFTAQRNTATLATQSTLIDTDVFLMNKSGVDYIMTWLTMFNKIISKYTERHAKNISTKTTNYTILDDDEYDGIKFTSSGIAILPTAADNNGREIEIIHEITNGLVTITPEGAEKINYKGADLTASMYLWNIGDRLTVRSDGTKWNIIKCIARYTSGWRSNNDWSDRFLGFSVIPYDGEVGTPAIAGETFVEETSGNTGTLFFRDATNLYVYNVTGTGYFTNNKKITWSGDAGRYVLVNTATTTKVIDSYAFFNLGLDIKDYIFQFFYNNTSGSFPTSIICGAGLDAIDSSGGSRGWSIVEFDNKNVYFQTANLYFPFILPGGNLVGLSTQEGFYYEQIIFQI
jgi:hypothetical protein